MISNYQPSPQALEEYGDVSNFQEAHSRPEEPNCNPINLDDPDYFIEERWVGLGGQWWMDITSSSVLHGEVLTQAIYETTSDA